MGSERGRIVHIFCQLAHVVFAVGLLAAAAAEFVSESPYFDLFRHPSVGHAQLALFRVS